MSKNSQILENKNNQNIEKEIKVQILKKYLEIQN
jgi:hypothetical protein